MHQATKKLTLRALLSIAPALVLIALGLAVRQPSKTDALALPVAMLADTTKDLSLDDVLALPESAWTLPKARAYRFITLTPRFVWLRLTLPPANDATEAKRTWIAEMDEPLFWELDFYLVEHGKLVDQARTGLQRPATDRMLEVPHSAFGLHRGVGRERQLYVRSMTDGDTIPPVKIRDDVTYSLLATHRGILFGLLLGCLIGTTACTAVLTVALRDRMYLNFLLVQLALTGIGVVSTGSLSLLDLEVSQAYTKIHYVVLALSLAAYVHMTLFALQFLRLDANASPRLINRMREALGVGIATLCVLPFLPIATAMLVIFAVITFIVLRIAMELTREIDQRFAFFNQMAVLTLLGCILISLLAYFGVIPGNLFNKQMYLVGAIFLGVSLGSSTALRVMVMEETRRKVITALTKDATGDLPTRGGKSAYSSLDVTVMFVDIASFSLISRSMPPSEAFTLLARRLKEIRRIINDAGGTIDRSLGDGILCFFDQGKDASSEDHAVSALMAARRIQELSTEAGPKGDLPPASPVLPVRIGIHSTRVLVGNLGGSARIDFTMIGAGVNFASRLETACNPFKVALSKETRDRLVAAGFDTSALCEIAVAVKHQEGLIDAYEYDPFHDTPEVAAQVEKRYADQLDLKRTAARFRLRPGCDILLTSERGELVVLDFSLLGFKVHGPMLLGRGTLLEVELTTDIAALQQTLDRYLMSRFEVEVRWGRNLGAGRFEHGLRIHGGSRKQSALLLRLLEQHVGEPMDIQEDHLESMLA